MPRLNLPADTTVSTTGIGYFSGTMTVSVEAVDVAPDADANSLPSGALFALGFGPHRLARLELFTAREAVWNSETATFAYLDVLRVQMWHHGQKLSYAINHDPVTQRWWRFRFCTDVIEIAYSPDRAEWFTYFLLDLRLGFIDPRGLSAVQVHLAHYRDRGSSPVVFDNLNVAMPPEADPGTPRRRTLNYLRAESTGGFNGAGVTVAVLDQGVSNAVRGKLGATLEAKLFADHIQFTDPTIDTFDRTSGLHGCEVAACCVTPGSRLIDIMIAGNSGSTADYVIADSIMAAVDAGAQVVNCSYGGGVESGNAPVRHALAYAAQYGVLVFFSAGNSGQPFVAYPSNLSRLYANCHSVGAFDERTDLRGSFSQYEDGQMTGVAPGVNVRGLLPDGTEITWNGTSASSPHAARTAVMLRTGDRFTGEQVGQALKETLRPTKSPPAEQGGGAYDFAAAAEHLGVPIASWVNSGAWILW